MSRSSWWEVSYGGEGAGMNLGHSPTGDGGGPTLAALVGLGGVWVVTPPVPLRNTQPQQPWWLWEGWSSLQRVHLMALQ